MNLLALAERWGEAVLQPTVSYEPARCLHALDKFAACTACQTICPVDAIQFGPPPLFSQDSCQHCRACLPVCPVGAYAAEDEVGALLNCAAELSRETCEVICGLNPHAEFGDPAAAAIRVRGCLAGLGVGAYLALVNKGLKQVVVRVDTCADCPWSSLRLQVETQVAQAQHILAAWDLAETLVYAETETIEGLGKRPFWNAGSPPKSRRDLFSWRQIEKEIQTQNKDASISANNPFRERLRILQALSKQPPVVDDGQLLQDLGFALISVNEACTACGVCSRACPTGALQMVTEGTSFQLLFTAAACIDCNVCSHVCTPQAITINHAVTYDLVIGAAADQIVQQGALIQCAKCKTSFAAKTDSRLCPTCEFRRQNPFGSTLPPALSATLKNADKVAG